ncbi:hypothetical protein GCM10009119_00460 [Algoriphagus jejuensis]|uniref:Uncharacterized protein n=1 Tax=Algoriphagus jejuensis TaxID=419934 RepID=A0ABN1MUM3_9BACT
MEVLRTAILDFCRRRHGRAVRPSDVLKQMFPQDWELFTEDIRVVMKEMHQENLIDLIPNENQKETVDQRLIILFAKPK